MSLSLSPPPGPPDDAALARRIAAGDLDALERLMRRYNQRLYRAVRGILTDEREAEEAVQDAYLKAYRAMGNYRGEARLSTWLTRIAINEARARARTRRRHAETVPLDDADGASGEAYETPAMHHPSDSPERHLLRGEVRRMIERNIDALPDTFRGVFVLRALEDLTTEETAACLGLPEATVRTRYFRARGLLRAALAREMDFNLAEAFSFDGERCNRIVGYVLTMAPGT